MTVWFGNPWLHGLAMGALVANLCMVAAAWAIWYERKFAGRMQNRPGPTEVGPYGLLQPVADAIKLLQKQNIIPAHVDRGMFRIAPFLVVVAALLTLTTLPFGEGLVIADLHLGVLFALSAASLMVIPVWMAGWSANNKYALLGGMRAVAQGISYEIPLLLSAMVPIVLAQSWKLGDIVAAQADLRWFALWPPGPGAGSPPCHRQNAMFHSVGSGAGADFGVQLPARMAMARSGTKRPINATRRAVQSRG